MTVIVVSKGVVLVDSLSTQGDLRSTMSKVNSCSLGRWTCAGTVSWAKLAIDATVAHGGTEGFQCPVTDPDACTATILKTRGGRIFWLPVVLDAVWQEMPRDEEVANVFGAGADFFLAYYGVFRDVEKALDLTVTYNHYCGPPVERF